jgi:hypothetical protein
LHSALVWIPRKNWKIAQKDNPDSSGTEGQMNDIATPRLACSAGFGDDDHASARAEVTGPYVSLGAGVNTMQAEPFTFPTVTADGRRFNDGNLKTTIGAVGLLARGWGFGNGLRAELEADCRFNGYNNLAVSGTNGSIGLSGSEQKYGPMVNLLYGFPIGCWKPQMTRSKRIGILALGGVTGPIASELGGRLSIPGLHGIVSTAQAVVERPLTSVNVAEVAPRAFTTAKGAVS